MDWARSLRAIRNKLQLRKRLGLPPWKPMCEILAELERRKVNPADLNALEVFGYTGEMHVMDYAPIVSTLEAWEIEPRYAEQLTRNIPKAEVKVVDSYEEIRNTPRKYSLIVVDPPLAIHGGHCEHFDLFPDIFRISKDSAVLVLRVVPELLDPDLKSYREQYPHLFGQTHLARRSTFYRTSTPERIPIREMVKVYEGLAEKEGFLIEWYFSKKQNFMHYLVLKIRRSTA